MMRYYKSLLNTEKLQQNSASQYQIRCGFDGSLYNYVIIRDNKRLLYLTKVKQKLIYDCKLSRYVS